MTAMLSFETMLETATQSGKSSAVMVGALFPGVIFVAISKRERLTLYVQRTYFWAAATF